MSVDVVEREKRRRDFHAKQQAEIEAVLSFCKKPLVKSKNYKTPEFIVKLTKYIYEEEKIEDDELASLVLYFETEKELSLHIEKHWGDSHFMKELFIFLDQANYSESETLQ